MSITTNRRVEAALPRQAELLKKIVDKKTTPGMLLVRDARRRDTSSYVGALTEGPKDKGPDTPMLRGHGAQLLRYAGKLGVELSLRDIVRVQTVTSREEVVEAVEEANQNPSIHGTMVLTPLQRYPDESKEKYRRAQAEVLAAVDPDKDIDFGHPYAYSHLNGNRPISPTPLAVIHGLQDQGLFRKDLKYMLQGSRGIVGSQVADKLRELFGGDEEYARRVHEIERDNAHELPEALTVSEVGIAAAGAAHVFTSGLLRHAAENRKDPGTRLEAVVGIGLDDFAPGARETAAELGIETTPGPMHPLELGFGGDTAVNLWDNLLAKAAVAAGVEEPRAAVAA